MKYLVNKALSLVGLKLQRLSPSQDPTGRAFETLTKLDFQPNFVIDIGANHGNWTRRALRHYPKASILMVEPQEHLRLKSSDLLSNSNVTWVTAGASDKPCMAKLTLAPIDHSSTFVLSERQATAAGLKQVEVPLITVNQLVADRGGQVPDIVKIDAEGLDLNVLDGASELIGKTEVFLVEAAVCARGIDNSLLAVISKMDRLGYVPFDITELNYSPKQGVLWLVEIVFIKRGGGIDLQIDASY